MEIQEMRATFGKLQDQTLSLKPGLNCIYAPNESGKSTWSHFLRIMLYGLSTRERGDLADKNRFAPWSGAAMRGQLQVADGNGTSLTLSRDTRRANAPMGQFACTYTGTATAVPGIDGQNAGETLLGVPREVFERSAFIRQSALAVDSDAELERRIAALITTGEEDVSYIEVQERLKKQLNRRRSNRANGQIPALEREIALVNSHQEETVRVASYASIAMHWLPELIEQFRRRYSGVSVDVQMGSVEEVYRWVREGRVDMAFASRQESSTLDWMPLKPDPLLTYICKIVRNISLNLYHRKEAAKRSSHYTIAMEEIEACIAATNAVEAEIEAVELAHIIERFLDTLTVENRVLFMRRYWFSDSCRDIAGFMGLTEKNVSVRLTRIREKLRQYLIEREVFI